MLAVVGEGLVFLALCRAVVCKLSEVVVKLERLDVVQAVEGVCPLAALCYHGAVFLFQLGHPLDKDGIGSRGGGGLGGGGRFRCRRIFIGKIFGFLTRARAFSRCFFFFWVFVVF